MKRESMVNVPPMPPTSEKATALVALPEVQPAASHAMRCVSSPSVSAPRRPSLVRVLPRIVTCSERE